MCFDNTAFEGHEFVEFVSDKAAGLEAIIAVHSTALGPAAGGCRLWAYPNSHAAATDALRLSKGMSYKNAMAGLPFGGGKAIIQKPARTVDRVELFKALGRAINNLNGKYITAEDVGVTVQDMVAVKSSTNFVSGLPQDKINRSPGGDPSPKTAKGVLHGIRAAVASKFHSTDLNGLRVAVQGLGGVGYNLCKELSKSGVDLVVADIQNNLVQKAISEFGARDAHVNDILFEDVDVVAPCALGSVLNGSSIPKISASIIAGGANNQLQTDNDGERLFQRGILYAPDYVINAGGIISVAAEYEQSLVEHQVWQKIENIHSRLTSIFNQSKREQTPTNVIADRIARSKITGGAHGNSHGEI
jgi:leucine dehydrogenase